MEEDLEQSRVIEAQGKDLDFRMYQERGGSAIDLLELAIPLLEKEKALPERIRVDLVRYLEKRLAAEIKGNKTDRVALRQKRLLPRQISQRVRFQAAFKQISEAKARREVLEKIRLLDGSRGLSEEALKKLIQRARR